MSFEQFGNYSLEDQLGKGGVAAVWRARHRLLGTEHALKILARPTRGSVRRLLREGRVQAQLQHPNIVPVTDIIVHEGRVALAMPLIQGGTLADLGRLRGRFPPREALSLFRPIIEAVVHAHAAGVLHRDLKPLNVMIERGVPRVADFGIARLLDPGDDPELTRPGSPMGTLGFCPPEQWASPDKVDERGDVFSLGAILFWMLTGQNPFQEDDSTDTLRNTLTGRHPDLRRLVPECPEHVVVAVHRALMTRPEARYASAMELAQALRLELRVKKIRELSTGNEFDLDDFAKGTAFASAHGDTLDPVLGSLGPPSQAAAATSSGGLAEALAAAASDPGAGAFNPLITMVPDPAEVAEPPSVPSPPRVPGPPMVPAPPGMSAARSSALGAIDAADTFDDEDESEVDTETLAPPRGVLTTLIPEPAAVLPQRDPSTRPTPRRSGPPSRRRAPRPSLTPRRVALGLFVSALSLAAIWMASTLAEQALVQGRQQAAAQAAQAGAAADAATRAAPPTGIIVEEAPVPEPAEAEAEAVEASSTPQRSRSTTPSAPAAGAEPARRAVSQPAEQDAAEPRQVAEPVEPTACPRSGNGPLGWWELKRRGEVGIGEILRVRRPSDVVQATVSDGQVQLSAAVTCRLERGERVQVRSAPGVTPDGAWAVEVYPTAISDK